MKEADIQKALDRAESLLKDADGKMFMVSSDTATVEGLDAIREDLGDAQHSVNNARQILAGLKVLMELDPHSLPSESVEPPDPDLLGHDYREDIKR